MGVEFVSSSRKCISNLRSIGNENPEIHLDIGIAYYFLHDIDNTFTYSHLEYKHKVNIIGYNS